ncbi:dihydrolipoyl dehydrogenase [Hoylesella oralis]|uniref:dihydrolipoyl dehydrogenase n=1 Tax=Hoylesella oralis TaxID=28134 RepID=UPI0028E84214|nr:dihydrolipoyl dehydrogenase [Hoylesella oralis]
MTKTDLIIIGCGPGGYRAAEYAAKHGLTVTIIENKHAGGTCLNFGCIPTKCYAHDAEIGDCSDFRRVFARKKHVVEQLRNGIETLMMQPGITFVQQGKGFFKDAKTIKVGEDEFTADNIIIATGAHAKLPPIDGISSKCVVTSTELLDFEHIPESLCIIGAGVIGMEFASAFQRFGSNVTLVEFMNECLPTMDSDIAKRLRKCLEKRNIKFYLQSSVKAITDDSVVFERKGKEATIIANTILVATGRVPNVKELNLKNAGVEYSGKGIPVNENMQTNIPHIYAIGDVNGRQMLAHAAIFQGFRAVNHILGKSDSIRFDIMPAAVFTVPEAACVGLTAEQCAAQGVDSKEYKGYYRTNGKALASEVSEGMVKIITDNRNDKIIGCHIYGAHAADMVQEIAALMNCEITLPHFADIIHTHPTLGEILQDIAINR